MKYNIYKMRTIDIKEKRVKEKHANYIHTYLNNRLDSKEDNLAWDILQASVAEYSYLHYDSPTIFIEARDLVEVLYKANYDIEDNTFAFPLNGICSIAFPLNTIIDGINLSGVILINFEKHFSKTITIMSKDEIFPYAITYLPGEQLEKLHHGIAIQFTSKDNLYKASIASYDDIKKILHNDPQTKVQKEIIIHLKIIIALCYYLKAFPDSLVKGLPRDIKYDKDKYQFNKNVMTIQTPQKIKDIHVAMHLRRAHFRCLRNERYKRNEDGSCRVLFISDIMVGGKIEAYTAKGI